MAGSEQGACLMRRFALPLLAVFLALPVAAQDADKPSGLQPLPEPPPPPSSAEGGVDAEQVTITKRGENREEEHRVNGKLYMRKITPPTGKPYYLVDHQGTDNWTRHELEDASNNPPM